ncbi:hypothetical protein FDECE_13967 [Fusarium decemcellulare]|nr:hypothetical protein FDECE_13967 [Fusarium decemcellulare]
MNGRANRSRRRRRGRQNNRRRRAPPTMGRDSQRPSRAEPVESQYQAHQAIEQRIDNLAANEPTTSGVGQTRPETGEVTVVTMRRNGCIFYCNIELVAPGIAAQTPVTHESHREAAFGVGGPAEIVFVVADQDPIRAVRDVVSRSPGLSPAAGLFFGNRTFPTEESLLSWWSGA